MTSYLLDTNVISEVRARRPHGALIAWLSAHDEKQLFLPAVAIGELQNGVELTRRQNPEKAGEIEGWIELLIATYRVLPMDAACFREWARLMHGRPDAMLSEDAMIAAIARVHGLTVLTRNERDFAHFHVAIVNPFKS